jgi:type II restriction enzyme
MGAGNWTGWTDDIVQILRIMRLSVGDQFTLAEVYSSEVILKQLYPKNNTIKAKIRQQLQILQEHNYIEFVNDNGLYELIKMI